MDQSSQEPASAQTSGRASAGGGSGLAGAQLSGESRSSPEELSREQSPAAPWIEELMAGRDVHDLSAVELVKAIVVEVGHLAQKEIELAKTEIKADLQAEAKTVGGLGLAALAGLTTVNLLLVTLVLALARLMAPWAAGLLVSGITLALAGIVALVAWNKRVRSPLARTRRTLNTLKDDARRTRERVL